MNKQEQKQKQKLKEFLEEYLPIVQGMPEIHANRYRTKGAQQFDLFVITNNYMIAKINHEVHAILGTRFTRVSEHLTDSVVGSDAAHDAVRNLERALSYTPYHFRYVEHTIK